MSKWLLVIGVVLGLVAVVLVNLHISSIESAQSTVEVLRLRPSVALAKGDTITTDMLQVEVLPDRFESLTRLAISNTGESLHWIENRSVTKDVEAGSLLLHTFFVDQPGERFAARIDKNMRALTLSAAATSAVAYFVEPGSRVDIVGTFQRTELKPAPAPGQPPEAVDIVETKMVLQNVKVLAVDQATTRGGYLGVRDEGFQTITLEVSPADAEKIIFARDQSAGRLEFILRNPEDDKIVSIPPADWNALK